MDHQRGGEMGGHFPFKLKRRAMIAVMGLPYSFRMEMANYIANWAKCPNLKLEVTLSKLANVEEQGAAGGAVMKTTNPSVLSDVAFNILCETAVSLLENDRYHPNCVVISFPTPTKPQLQKLLSLHVYGCDDDDGDEDKNPFRPECYYIRPHRLLIIECQRRNKFRWRQAVEHPDQGTFFNRRYDTGNREPGKWEDVEKAILNHQHEGLDDYLITLAAADQCCDVDVKKLVVDPFQDLRARDFTKTQGLHRSSLFAEAIKYYINCDYDEYKDLGVSLDYALWRQRWLEHRASSSRRGASSTAERHWCGSGDCILRFTKNLEAEAICDACDVKFAEGEGGYYYCQFCSLSLHELCALAESPTAITAKNTNPHSQVVSDYVLSTATTTFKGSTHACHSCKKDGKQFSEECDACLFRTHLKGQLLPTALKHSCDQHHFLSIRLSWRPSLKTLYDCKACGLRGAYNSYCCNICNSEYHLECVLDMPLHTKTKEIAHGGHTHTIKIDFSCGQREYEYKWCCVCYDDINPDIWVYTCQHCDFVAHLYCIFPSELFEVYKGLTVLTAYD